MVGFLETPRTNLSILDGRRIQFTRSASIVFLRPRALLFRSILMKKCALWKKSSTIGREEENSLQSGKLVLSKTLVLSKLIYCSSILTVPKVFVEKINKIIFNFIWDDKPPKIKKKSAIDSFTVVC